MLASLIILDSNLAFDFASTELNILSSVFPLECWKIVLQVQTVNYTEEEIRYLQILPLIFNGFVGLVKAHIV